MKKEIELNHQLISDGTQKIVETLENKSPEIYYETFFLDVSSKKYFAYYNEKKWRTSNKNEALYLYNKLPSLYEET